MIEYLQLWMSVLASVSLKAVIISVFAFGFISLLKFTDAAFQHRIWTSIMISMLLMPVLMFCVPIWSVPLLSQESSQNVNSLRLPGSGPSREGEATAEPLKHATLPPSTAHKEPSPSSTPSVRSRITNAADGSLFVSPLNESQVTGP
jgi:hypothetical protein